MTATVENQTQLAGSGECLFEGRLSDSVERLWLHYYPVSRHAHFKELLQQNIRRTDRVLEIGAGSGRRNQNHFSAGCTKGPSKRGSPLCAA